jgi:AraC-like DNA-binding protein
MRAELGERRKLPMGMLHELKRPTASPAEHALFMRVKCGDYLDLLNARYVRQRFAPHHHDTWSFGVIEAGAGRTRFRGATLTVAHGEVAAMAPGETHTGEPLGDDGWAYRMLYPSAAWCARLVESAARESGRNPHFLTPTVCDPELARMVRAAHLSLESGDDELRSEELLTSAVVTLFARHAAVELAAVTPDLPAVRRVVEYLRAHLRDQVRLADLASIAGLSSYHLIRVFGRSVGLPPYTYLEQLRIEKAKELLRAGLGISEVAFDTGFADQSHLTRRFKRVVGVPPGQYVRAVA